MKKEKTSPQSQGKVVLEDIRNLVVYNDNVNTFDFVISTLIEVCKHDAEQAEQCTLIIHHNGRCVVKKGNFPTLEPLCQEILNRGITASIE